MSSDFLHPLRVLHGKMYEWKIGKAHQYMLWKHLNTPFGKKVYIFGTPTHTNLGDSAIVLAQMQFLVRCGIPKERIKELTMNEYNADEAFVSRYTSAKGLIAQLGGGNMGNQWLEEEYLHRRLLLNHTRNPEIIFPQTIHYLDDEKSVREKENSVAVYNGRKQLILIAREQISHNSMVSLYPDTRVLLTPDIVLSCEAASFGVEPQARENNVMLCFRSDAEKMMTDEQQADLERFVEKKVVAIVRTDMHATSTVTKENRFKLVRDKMQEFASSKLVITDRLHGMIFAAITGTPCIAFGNYNHKVKGTYEWIKYLPYIRYVESVEEAKQVFPELLEMKDCQYDNTPLQPYFDQIKEVVKQYA